MTIRPKEIVEVDEKEYQIIGKFFDMVDHMEAGAKTPELLNLISNLSDNLSTLFDDYLIIVDNCRQ